MVAPRLVQRLQNVLSNAVHVRLIYGRGGLSLPYKLLWLAEEAKDRETQLSNTRRQDIGRFLTEFGPATVLSLGCCTEQV